jgi:hypothetical protein
MIALPDAFLLGEGRVVEEGDLERLKQLEALVLRGFARKKRRGKLYCRMPGDADQSELLNPECEGYAIAAPGDDILHFCSICERPLSPAKKRAVDYYCVWPNREAIASEVIAGLGREGFAFREAAHGVFHAETFTGPVYVILVAQAKDGAALDPEGSMRKRAVYLLSSASEEARIPPGSEWSPLLEALDAIGPIAHYLRAVARLVPPWSLAPNAAVPKLRLRTPPAPRSDPTMSSRVFHGLNGPAPASNTQAESPPSPCPPLEAERAGKVAMRVEPLSRASLVGVPSADVMRVLADVITHEGHRELRMEDLRLLRERAKEYRLFIDGHGATLRDETGRASNVEVTRVQLLLLGELARRQIPLAPSELQFARDTGLFDAERLLERVRARIDTKRGRYEWTLLHTVRGNPKRYLWRPPSSYSFAIILPRE